MKRRQMQDDGGPSTNSWLATYADMVTLLLCFFVLLFSMSAVEEQKFRSALSSLQIAFGVFGSERAQFSIPDDAQGPGADELQRIALELERLEAVAKSLGERLKASGLEDKVSIHLEERGLVLRFLDSVLFDVGSASVKPEALTVIMEVGKQLVSLDNQLRVEGHTDDWPIVTSLFPSNWELSTGRATQVVRFLQDECDIPGDRLQAAGFGQYRPVDTNETEEGRQQNRRIDVIVLRTSLSGLEPQGSGDMQGGVR